MDGVRAATKFEFEHRFWIICAIYFVGFALSAVDHAPFIVALRRLIAPSIARDNPEAEQFARIVISIGALLVFLTAALRTWGAAYLRTSVVHDTAQHSDALVADGPFRYTRNPLYLANLPMAAGIGVLASLSGFIFRCWRTGFLRRRGASLNSGRILSSILSIRPAVLAFA
jgi:protein-S-isoprenylcysteine O-methyltransferase Ste14